MSIKGDLNEIEARIEDVKRKYDLFFQGMLKAEPSKERKELEAKVRKMGQRSIPNTSDQFLFNTLRAKFYSYLRMWERVVLGIEEGRIQRDLGGRVAFHDHGPVSEDNLNKAYLEFLNAKKELNQPYDGIEFTSFKEMLTKRALEIKDKSGCNRVNFNVVVEGGKAKIKAKKK